MILIKIWYKTYNNVFLAIIKVFKTWYHYLKDYKHKVFIFIEYKNLYYFINLKNLSFKKVY